MNLRLKRVLDVRRPEFIVLIIALVFSYVSAFLVPQLSVNDEGAHFLKSYSLSTGHFSGGVCRIPESIVEKIKSNDNHANPSIDYSKIETVSCGSAAGYTPLMHFPQSIGILTSRLFGDSTYQMVLFGRLANATFYSLALFFIIRYARVGKWAFIVVGLFPLMIHSAGSLSADVMNNVVVLSFFAYVFNLFIQKHTLTRKQLLVLALFSLLLALTKTTNVIFLLLLAPLPAKLFNFREYKTGLLKWLFIFFIGILTVATLYISQKIFGSMLFHSDDIQNPLAHDPLRFFYIVYNTYLNPALGYGDLVFRGIVGEFSSFKYHLPTWAIFVETLLLILTVLVHRNDQKFTDKKSLPHLAITSAISATLFIMAVTLGLYSAWAILPTRLGTGAIYADGVQGRYFTSALLLIVPVGLWLQNYVTIKFAHKLAFERVVISVSTLVLLYYIAETIVTFS